MTTYAYNDAIFTRSHIAIADYAGYADMTDVYQTGVFDIISFNITGPVSIDFHSYGGFAAYFLDGVDMLTQLGPSTPAYTTLFTTSVSIGSGSHTVVLKGDGNGIGGSNFAFAGMVTTGGPSGVPRSRAYDVLGSRIEEEGLDLFRTAVAGRVSTAVLWAAIGDSVTLGTGASDSGHKWVNLLDGALDAYWGSYFTPTNDGVSGAKVSDINSGGYAAALNSGTDLVTIELGINDCFASVSIPTYTTNMNTLIDAVQAQCAGASIVIIGAHLVDTVDPGDWPDFLAAMVTIAAAQGCAYIEFATIFGDPDTSPLIGDGVHPNDAGHKVYADMLFRFLT